MKTNQELTIQINKIVNDIKNEYPTDTINTLMNFTSTHDITRAINIFSSNDFNEWSEWAWDLKNNDLNWCLKYKLSEEEYKKGIEMTVNQFMEILKNLGVEASLLYDNKSIALSDGTNESKKTLHYVSLPINAKYTIGFSSLASVYFATGPQFSWNVGDRSWAPKNIQAGWELKKSEFSWNVGAGGTALKHIRVGYNYNIGIGKTAEATVLGTAINGVKGKLKNNTHQVSLTYIF